MDTNQPARERYQQLLREEWDEATADKAIDILRQILADTPWVARLDQLAETLMARSFWPLLDLLSDPLHEALPPLPPADTPLPDPQGDPHIHRAYRAMVYLLLPTKPGMFGAFAPALLLPAAVPTPPLIRDVQSVLFQSTVFEVLPVLQDASRPVHDLLVHGLHAHALLFWRHQPAQQQLLFGLLYDYLKDREHSTAALERSFTLTPVQSHDFLTRAQLYWSHLIETGQRQAAEQFVLTLYRQVPPEHLAEVATWIQEIYRSPQAAA